MKKIITLAANLFLYLFLIISFLFVIFHYYFYTPALNSYIKIDENAVSTIFTLASITASCEGLKSLPADQKFKEPYYKQDLMHSHKELKKSQSDLYVSITHAQPYLDKATEQKLKDFIKWTQEQEYARLTNNTCPELKTSYKSLIEQRDALMKTIPFTIKKYFIFYIRKNWFKSIS